MSLIDFSSIADRTVKKQQQPDCFPYDSYFPQSVSFVGEPWTILSKHIGKLEQNAVINFWTFGRYAMHDIINYVCRQIGACKVTACTWAISEKAVTQVLNRMRDGLITDFKLWIDPRVKVRNPIPLQMCQANFPVAIAPVHAKICLFENEQWKVSVCGSLNFTTNPQPERGVIQTIAHVYDNDLKILYEQFDREANR
ncbi:hypothetical protein LJC68_08965 [Bacteroidales bacterium OttesenSCG-928-B11]|nr:hypothetical protein [Bacteroidales bacterium OttesenSCG-928-C03]MDL2312990.1 hypothetical protein [Bacteroidales bacterium OttesenSCG-928-B11]